MKRFMLIVCLLIAPGLVFTAHAESQGPFGLGVYLGEPTGITGKYWIDKSEAVDVTIGFNHLSIQADYLFTKWDLFAKPPEGEIGVYCGPGLRLRDSLDKTQFGFRLVGGVAYELPEYQIEIFAEFVPVLDVTPDVKMKLNGGVGVRYYF